MRGPGLQCSSAAVRKAEGGRTHTQEYMGNKSWTQWVIFFFNAMMLGADGKVGVDPRG